MTHLQMTHSLKWPIHEWPIHLNDPFTQMIHSLNDPFTWECFSADPSIWMTHSPKWPIHLNDPFAWMTHPLEWPIQLKVVLSASFFF